MESEKPTKSKVEMLKNKLEGIAKILTGTKLRDFADYLCEIQKDIGRLKEMWDTFENTPSFSEKLILEERIPKKIKIIRDKTEKIKKRIGVIIDEP